MKIIEKIEIKSFRSFANRKQNKNLIEKIEDLNIFTGANDSGKSNILRALNLFFNKRTNLADFLNFNNDFFKREDPDEDDVEEEMITVRITFWNKKNEGKNKKNINRIFLPEKFWVSRKWLKNSEFSTFQEDNGIKTAFKTEKKEKWRAFYEEDEKTLKPNVRASLSKQLTDFLDSIQYHYVPAIKDKSYFAHLYGELQQTLLKEENTNLNKNKELFQEAIQNSTSDLMSDFKKVVNNKTLNIEAAFELPDLINLFKTLNVQTGKVDLKLRGDGIQAKLIPEILNFIALKESQIKPSKIKKGEKAKKYFIWGFEEPENSYEYKNAQLLANRFIKIFAKNAQIFITTHSKEFLSIKREFTDKETKIHDRRITNKEKISLLEKLKPESVSANIAIYRVWKNKETKYASQITRFDEKRNNWEKVCDDLGIIQDSRMMEFLQQELNEQTKAIAKSKLDKKNQEKVKAAIIGEMEECLQKLKSVEEKVEEYEKPILYVEDKYDQIYKIAYLKTEKIDCTKDDFNKLFKEKSFFALRRGEGASGVAGRLRAKNTDGYEDKKIIGLFDFDKEGRENFHHLSKESFWVDDYEGDKESGFYKRRTDHGCFSALLLPIPERLHGFADLAWENFVSYVQIENLLPENFLHQNKFINETNCPAGQYCKIKENKKDKIWKKLFDLDSDQFLDFIPLFNKIKELFNSKTSE